MVEASFSYEVEEDSSKRAKSIKRLLGKKPPISEKKAWKETGKQAVNFLKSLGLLVFNLLRLLGLYIKKLGKIQRAKDSKPRGSASNKRLKEDNLTFESPLLSDEKKSNGSGNGFFKP